MGGGGPFGDQSQAQVSEDEELLSVLNAAEPVPRASRPYSVSVDGLSVSATEWSYTVSLANLKLNTLFFVGGFVVHYGLSV